MSRLRVPTARLAPRERRALLRVSQLASVVLALAVGSGSAPARRPAEFRLVQERL